MISKITYTFFPHSPSIVTCKRLEQGISIFYTSENFRKNLFFGYDYIYKIGSLQSLTLIPSPVLFFRLVELSYVHWNPFSKVVNRPCKFGHLHGVSIKTFEYHLMIFFALALTKYMEKNPNKTQTIIETYFPTP